MAGTTGLATSLLSGKTRLAQVDARLAQVLESKDIERK